MGVGHEFFDQLKGGHNFFDELKGGSLVFCSFIFKSGFPCLTMFFLNNLVWILNKFLTKMGNEIVHLMPIKYKIFFGKGALPPYNPRKGASPLRTPRSQTVFKMNDAHAYTSKRAQRGRGHIFYDSRVKWATQGNSKLVEAWNLL